MKKIGFIVLGVWIIGSLVSAMAPTKVKVIVYSATVRSQPDYNSEIITQVPQDTILELKEISGEWFLVQLPPDESGVSKTGYIHSRVVEEVQSSQYPSAENQIRVLVHTANVRVKPDYSSSIIAQVSQGATLELKEISGDWYFVQLPPDESGVSKTGYVHQRVAERIMPAQQQTVRTQPRAQQPVSYEPERPRVAPPSQEGISTGFFLKFGWMTKPDAGGFGYSWLSAVGMDFSLAPNFTLGIEVQPAIRSYSDLDLTEIPVMAFVNGKGGINLGSLWRVLRVVNLFGGVGVGAEASFSTFKNEGQSYSNFDVKLAYHLLFGAEINLKSLALIAEYQITQVSDPAVDPDFWRHYWLFGIRF